MRQVVFDIETTGLDVSDGHRVIEIGCIEIKNRIVTDKYLHLYINPNRDIDKGALAVHGLTTEFLSDKPIFSEVVDEFLKFIDGSDIIAHNAQFDVKFLNNELDMLGLSKLDHYCRKIIDSLVLARKMRPGKRNSLDALCDYYRISNLERKFHGALLDSKLLSQVWLAMTRGQDELIINNDNKIDYSSSANNNLTNSFILVRSKANEEEIENHEKYLNDMEVLSGQVLWKDLESK